MNNEFLNNLLKLRRNDILTSLDVTIGLGFVLLGIENEEFKQIKQSKLANKIGVDRSTINKEFKCFKFLNIIEVNEWGEVRIHPNFRTKNMDTIIDTIDNTIIIIDEISKDDRERVMTFLINKNLSISNIAISKKTGVDLSIINRIRLEEQINLNSLQLKKDYDILNFIKQHKGLNLSRLSFIESRFKLNTFITFIVRYGLKID